MITREAVRTLLHECAEYLTKEGAFTLAQLDETLGFLEKKTEALCQLAANSPWDEQASVQHRWQEFEKRLVDAAGLGKLCGPGSGVPPGLPENSLRLFPGNVLVLSPEVVNHLRAGTRSFIFRQLEPDGTVLLIGERTMKEVEEAEVAGTPSNYKIYEDGEKCPHCGHVQVLNLVPGGETEQ